MLRKEAAGLRRDYAARGLHESDVQGDPMAQFEAWYREALGAGMLEPNAMTLATASPEGRPSARVVLLKDFDARGFTFFTNHDSRKGRELERNPYAALCFWWDAMERQVRIEGKVEPVEPELSDAYFASRPLGSRLGAWASRQSSVIGGRADLEERLAAVERQHAGGEVPRPPHWGGYRLRPAMLEFWQGRPSRLHDRLVYTLQPEGSWRLGRLSP